MAYSQLWNVANEVMIAYNIWYDLPRFAEKKVEAGEDGSGKYKRMAEHEKEYRQAADVIYKDYSVLRSALTALFDAFGNARGDLPPEAAEQARETARTVEKQFAEHRAEMAGGLEKNSLPASHEEVWEDVKKKCSKAKVDLAAAAATPKLWGGVSFHDADSQGGGYTQIPFEHAAASYFNVPYASLLLPADAEDAKTD